MSRPGNARAAALLALLSCLTSACGVPGAPMTAIGAARFDGTLSVLTYNIKGSAWPIASGRPPELDRIATRLLAMRRRGANPQIVVLQEAFTDQARSIGREAGYRFVVDGPAASDRNDAPMTAADRQFAAGASWWRGEAIGKLVGSGIQVLSDYPVIRVRRMAYPAFACAGYDCLANKGALLVTVRAPGAIAPIDILTTHLNCRHHSGVGDARSLYAYRRQVDFLTAFINREHDPAIPLVAAGDFNAGRARPRWLALDADVPQWHGAAPFREALGQVVRDGIARGAAIPANVAAVLRHGADLEFFTSGLRARLRPVAIRVPFGPDAAGTMLSDHIGYIAQFRLTRS